MGWHMRYKPRLGRGSTSARAGLALVVGATVLVVAGILWATGQARHAVEDQVLEGQQAAIAALLGRVDVAYETAVRAATGAAERPGLTRAVTAGDSAEAARVLANVAELAPFSSLVIYRDGAVLAAHPADAPTASRRPVTSPSVSGPRERDGTIVIEVDAPFLDGTEVIGQLTATVPFRALAGGDDGLHLSEAVDVTLVDDNATVLASVIRTSEGQKLLAPEALALIAARKPATATYYAPRYQAEVLSTFVPSASRPWHALAVSRRTVVLRDSNILGERLWLGGALLVLALLALIMVATRYVSRAERSLRNAQAGLAERNTDLEAVNAGLASFASVAAHDLRSPLQTIKGFADLLTDVEHDRLSDNGRQAVAAIHRQASVLTALVNGLLDYARAGTTPVEHRDIDAAQLLADVLDRLAALRQERGAEIFIGTLPDTIDGDPALLGQVVQNIVANAIAYGDPEHPVVSIDGSVTSSSVRIRISDNGPGVAESERDSIFQMLVRGTASSARPGTGIGLAMAARIVERHHGRIIVTEARGGGATFIVELPTRHAREVEASATGAAERLTTVEN